MVPWITKNSNYKEKNMGKTEFLKHFKINFIYNRFEVIGTLSVRYLVTKQIKRI